MREEESNQSSALRVDEALRISAALAGFIRWGDVFLFV